MSPMGYLGLVAGMGLVTYLPRWAPLVALARRRIPRRVGAWLELLPPAILAALLAPALLAAPDPRHLDLGRPELWAAVPTCWCAWRTRSLGLSVALGMGLYWLITRVGLGG